VLRDLIATGDAVGDPELIRELVRRRGRLTHTIAAVVVDLGARPVTRWARLTTDKPASVVNPVPKVDADPSFELGSIAKGLTGMLLADAIERGELTLDTTAGEILATRPALAERTRGALDSITLRELATHSSGLPRLPRTAGTAARVLRLAVLGMDPYRGQTPERVLQLAARQSLRDPGSYGYSNLGGAVAGQLIAIAAGADYPTLLRDRILAPLEMTSTAVASAGVTAARGRSKSGLSRQAWILDGYAPAGGVIATIEDVARLTQALTDGTAPGIASLTPLPGAPPSAPGREAAMFWIAEPLGRAEGQPAPAGAGAEGPRAPEGQPAPVGPGADPPTLTWHNGMTAGYSAFLGVLRDRGRGVAVLADAARGPEQRAVALELLRGSG
jgi:CubicO group peptidase (beta-lactamase class C family)